ncbi:MAG: lysylphosphatidylglycerol synthase transmembrane domain-containing protein [Myxococcota bacterium]
MRLSPRRALQALLAVVLSVLAFGIALRDVDFGVVQARVAAVPIAVWGTYFLGQLAVHGVRVLRWGLLVRPLGPVSWREIIAAGSVGFPATFFLPLRLGEFVRPTMTARKLGFTKGLTSVVIERAADGLLNVMMFFSVSAFLPGALPHAVRRGSLAALGFFALVMLFLAGALVWPGPCTRVLGVGLGLLGPRLKAKGLVLWSQFLSGLAPLRHPARTVGFVGLTGVFWLANGYVTWVLVQALAGEISWMSGPFVVSVATFAIMVPAGPAFAGTFELGFTLGLTPFGVPPTEAAAAALVAHGVQVLTMTVIGAAGLLVAGAGGLSGLTRART